MRAQGTMPKLPAAEKAILFLNNLAGDDLWEYGNLMMPEYQKYSAPLEFFKYKGASRSGYNSEGVYITSVPYALNGHGKVQLYGFPFLTIDVEPFDVEYSLPIHGLVVTEDMRMFDYFMEQDPNFFNIANSKFSRLAWAQTQNLPTVLAVHHADGYDGDLEALRRLVGMEIFCPVVWHDGELAAVFLHQAVESILTKVRQA